MAFEQKHLNVPVRAEAYLEMIVYTLDTSIKVASVTSNDVLSYSDINSITDIKKYSSTTIATLEENLWLLNGNFVNPTFGRKYNGYISNSISDDEGNFQVNPKININLLNSHKVEDFTLILNPAVKSAYPKQVIVRFKHDDEEIISLEKNIINETSLPNLVFSVNQENINNLEIEFVGTMFRHRRIRLATAMFGKAINLTDEEIIESDYEDKCSYVADSIPSRTFSFKVNNFSKKYSIDNPANTYINLDRTTRILFHNGYNIAGYNEQAKEFYNEFKLRDIQWDDWKELRLIKLTTDKNKTATFEFGSILDVMTDIYTNERFINNRKLKYVDPSTGIETGIVVDLMDFLGLPLNTIVFSTDNDGKSYADYEINTPIPALPVREILQLLAFSVGATLLIQDDGTIKFANLDLDRPSSFTRNHTLSYSDFTDIPEAVELENTTDISLPKYNSVVEDSVSDCQTITITSSTTEISYSACVPIEPVKENLNAPGQILEYNLFCERGNLICNLPDENGMSIKIKGHKIETKITQERSVTKDTLILDTKLIKDDPGNKIKNKYKRWYGQKFKYNIGTRGEPLIDAGDWINIQTEFTATDNNKNPREYVNGFVLQNNLHYDGTWSGSMEVVAIWPTI